MAEDGSPLLRLPAEIRLDIYHHLLLSDGAKTLAIRNRTQRDGSKPPNKLAPPFKMFGRTIPRRSTAETPYRLKTDVEIHSAIMCVNRQTHLEASELVYGKHCFDFGEDIEAVVPFLEDRTLEARRQISEISVQLKPAKSYEGWNDDWMDLCRYLAEMGTLKKLRLVVQGGRPTGTWDGPKELLVSDLRLLWRIKHDIMAWAGGLALLRGIPEVEIAPDVRYLAPPTTAAALLYAALSASINTSLVEFLRSDLKLQATAAEETSCLCLRGWCGCGEDCRTVMIGW